MRVKFSTLALAFFSIPYSFYSLSAYSGQPVAKVLPPAKPTPGKPQALPHALPQSSSRAPAQVSSRVPAQASPQASPQPLGKVPVHSVVQPNSGKIYQGEISQVWRALEDTLSRYKILEREPKVGEKVDFSKFSGGSFETDWIYTQYGEKNERPNPDGSPPKVLLQLRYKYYLGLKKTPEGISVAIRTEEEIEQLRKDGSYDGYKSWNSANSIYASQLLEKLNVAVTLRSSRPSSLPSSGPLPPSSPLSSSSISRSPSRAPASAGTPVQSRPPSKTPKNAPTNASHR